MALDRAKQILREALALPVEGRSQFILERTATDAALKELVEDLLRDNDNQTQLGPAEAEDRVGDWVGPYRLLQILGEGGFGVVWLAERRGEMVQRVALKIVKPGMDTRMVIARFEQERQALAVMDHPNVARVYNAGATPNGRPYFVMEYIQGEPITDFCDRQRMPMRERLELFVPVCEAVQHAHTKGIIHRDIKPSNVLVTQRDGTVVPKVIDFGVAKAISHTLTERTIFTERGQLIGTPEYMSPEQAEMGALDVDARTDVYSLGVVLYELLTGILPFDPDELRSKGYLEIQRIIREVEPPRPSTRLTSIGARAATLAERRKTQAGALSRQLRLELEWLPLMAMRKDRSRRYSTAQQMADDIRNYLAGRPLIAGPESLGYRVKKFLARNAVATGVGAVFLTVLAAALVVSVRAYSHQREATEQAKLSARAESTAKAEAVAKRTLAEQAEARARQEAGRADALGRYLAQKIFLSITPEQAQGRTVTFREVVDRAAAAIGTDLKENEEAQAEVRYTLGAAYRRLARYTSAVEQLRAAIEIQRRVYSAPNVKLADSLYELAMTFVDSNGMSGVGAIEGPEAVRAMTEAADIRASVLGETAAEVVRARLDVEWAKSVARDGGVISIFDPAMVTMVKAVCGCTKSVEEFQADIQKTIESADAEWRAGRKDEAMAWVEKLRKECCPNAFGPQLRGRLADSLVGAAINIWNKTSYYGAAEVQFLDAERVAREVNKEDSPVYLACRNRYTGFLVDQHRLGEAEDLAGKQVLACERVMGKSDRETMEAREYLAVCRIAKGDESGAREALTGDDTSRRWTSLATWEVVVQRSYRPEAYRLALTLAKEAAAAKPGSDNLLVNLAMAHYRASEYDAALATLASVGRGNDKLSPFTMLAAAAFKSMAHRRLGNKAEADQALDELRGLIASGKGKGTHQPERFLAEAEQVARQAP